MNELDIDKNLKIISILNFSIGDTDLAINSYLVSEVIVPKNITKIPKSPEFIAGFTNLRGEIIGVINLAKRLSLNSIGKNSENKIIVYKVKDEKVGFFVDKVEGMIKIDENKIEALTKYNFCKARIILNGKNIIILDVEDVLTFNK